MAVVDESPTSHLDFELATPPVYNIGEVFFFFFFARTPRRCHNVDPVAGQPKPARPLLLLAGGALSTNRNAPLFSLLLLNSRTQPELFSFKAHYPPVPTTELVHQGETHTHARFCKGEIKNEGEKQPSLSSSSPVEIMPQARLVAPLLFHLVLWPVHIHTEQKHSSQFPNLPILPELRTRG
ncbi:hypothetical protein LY78DRAFT_127005 [Colletotrichum sublineola]|nr:hypothetical protein LY78DRAFT_127005 [Colletotrichum sublineola]